MSSTQPWPKRPDGTPKTLGEMTREERRSVIKDALVKLKAEIESPQFREAMQRGLLDA